jgi:predicted branched-subunit amino acid permease
MAKKFHRFIWQFVIGLGFLSGLWTAVGIDPEGILISTLGSAVGTLSPDPALRALFMILPTLLLIGSVIGAYRNGKVPGLVSVLVAYGAGLVILSSAIAGLVLLGVAIVLAYYSTRKHRK